MSAGSIVQVPDVHSGSSDSQQLRSHSTSWSPLVGALIGSACSWAMTFTSLLNHRSSVLKQESQGPGSQKQTRPRAEISVSGVPLGHVKSGLSSDAIPAVNSKYSQSMTVVLVPRS